MIISGATLNGVSISPSFTPAAPGQQAYTTAGTYSWTAPAGVISVSVVAVGGGGSGARASSSGTQGPSGGAGGGLGYKNNITVVPGQSYTIVVGAGGVASGSYGQNGSAGNPSYFIDTSTVVGYGGGGGYYNGITRATGGSYIGDGGGSGGYGGFGLSGNSNRIAGGGGGAAGYSGFGGQGGTPTSGGPAAGSAATTSSGGAGGGSSGSYPTGYYGSVASPGGGVGILGLGVTGGSTSIPTSYNHATSVTLYGGKGGSGGADALDHTDTGADLDTQTGGLYGGGGGAAGPDGFYSHAGGSGAIRIIWPGDTRQFPSTRTTDE